MIAVIDCRVDRRLENDFLTLNLWGKPVFAYVVEQVSEMKNIEQVFILTTSGYVKHLCGRMFNGIDIVEDIPNDYPMLFVSGRAAFVKRATLEKVVDDFKFGGGHIRSGINERMVSHNILDASMLDDNFDNKDTNVFMIVDSNYRHKPMKRYTLNYLESIVVNNIFDFELALVMKKKEINKSIITKAIMDRIDEKKAILSNDGNIDGVCLVGHSQIDNWEISLLGGMTVRNCGIRAISSSEYSDYILDFGLLSCTEKTYIIMHGTNDIVSGISPEEICRHISKTINYIRDRQPDCKLYFIQCLHVNGRADRSNGIIDNLNGYLKQNLENVTWIETSQMDDEYGNLKAEYTIDGLHLSEKGYGVLTEIIESELAK